MKTLTSICAVTIAALAILNAPEALPISGTQPPTVNLSPTQLAFAEQGRPNCRGYQQGVTLTNDGPGVLDIGSIAINSTAFTQTHACSRTLGVGKSCSIAVTWRASFPGKEYGALHVTDNGTGSPQTVSLSGYCFNE
jgi:hypothetical protein